MLVLRIRKAEVALKHGRIDEALHQVLAPDVRDHYRGQKLIAKLIPAFVARGEQHLADGHPDQALADFERAGNLAGNQPSIAQLKSAAQVAIRKEVIRLRTQQNQLQHAKHLVAVGEYSLGQALCEDLSTPDASQFAAELQWRKQSLVQLLESAKESLRSGDLESAFPKAQQLLAESSRNRDVADFMVQLANQFAEQTKRMIAEGRLEHARGNLSRAHVIAPNHSELRELADSLEQCLHSASFLSHVDHHQLTRRLKALRQIVGTSLWLDKAIKDSESLAQSLEGLRAATGCLLDQTLHHPVPTSASSKDPQHQIHPLSPGSSSQPWSSVFRLNVDEAGSFLVLRKPDIAIGPSSQSNPTDVELQAPPDTPRVRIVRSDGDYFLHADHTIMVNQLPVRDKLLQDGDRVQLGPRVAFRFRKANAASGSANIELSSATRLTPFSLRHIVLMDESLILGPNSGSHIVIPGAEGAAILCESGGELSLRPYSSQPGNYARMAPGTILPAERPVSINSISVVAIPINKELRKFTT